MDAELASFPSIKIIPSINYFDMVEFGRILE